MRFSPSRAVSVIALLLAAGWLAWTGGPFSPFDRETIARAAAARSGDQALTPLLVALTWAGSVYATLGSAALGAIWRWMASDRRGALWLAVTVGGGRLVVDALKLVIERPRPAFDPHLVPVSSFAFPSGHAANSLVAFGALALAASPERHRVASLSAAVILSLMIGATRPYLGVHWPSDVLGGWLIGAAILLAAAPFRPRGRNAA